MKTPSKQPRTVSVPDNALASQALEAIQQIELESRGKKLVQIEALQSASTAIQRRIDELSHQLGQIDVAIASITGHPVQKERRARRSLDAAREQIERWMQDHKGQKFMAGDLIR